MNDIGFKGNTLMKQLQTEKDYNTATRFFHSNKEHLARYLYDKCFIVILKDNVLGIFPNWEYTIEDIREIYKTNTFKNELIILSPIEAFGGIIKKGEL